MPIEVAWPILPQATTVSIHVGQQNITEV